MDGVLLTESFCCGPRSDLQSPTSTGGPVQRRPPTGLQTLDGPLPEAPRSRAVTEGCIRENNVRPFCESVAAEGAYDFDDNHWQAIVTVLPDVMGAGCAGIPMVMPASRGDAFAAQDPHSPLHTWTIWADTSIDHPTWAIHASAYTPASLLAHLTEELRRRNRHPSFFAARVLVGLLEFRNIYTRFSLLPSYTPDHKKVSGAACASPDSPAAPPARREGV